MIDEAVWAAALAALRGADTVAICGHVHPDGDTLGGVLALTHALRHLGIPVRASVPEPFIVPRQLRILPGQDLLVPSAELGPADVFVAVDTASPSRLGNVAVQAEAAGTLLVVDHHVSNDGFGDIALLDPDAAAAGLVVAELIDRLGVPYDVPIATCLYAAIASDTGSFRHASTTPQVHRLAARLLAVGVPHESVSRSLFDTRPAGWLPLLSTVLGRVVLDQGAVDGLGLVWTSVTVADLDHHDVPFDQAEAVVDVVRSAENADVAAVFKEHTPGVWLVSTRSRGRCDVGSVCTSLGGGGHRFAAGYTARGSLADAVAALRSALDRAGRGPERVA